MSHWAEIDTNNNVLRVTVGNNNDPAGDEGYQWLLDNLGGIWIKASYNKNIRKNFPNFPGFTYDSVRDAFIPPKCHNEALLIEETCNWNCNNIEHQIEEDN
jgi:hypothetical protein